MVELRTQEVVDGGRGGNDSGGRANARWQTYTIERYYAVLAAPIHIQQTDPSIEPTCDDACQVVLDELQLQLRRLVEIAYIFDPQFTRGHEII